MTTGHVVLDGEDIKEVNDLGFDKCLRAKLEEEDASYPRLVPTAGMKHITKYIASVEKVKRGKVATAAILAGMRYMNKELGKIDKDEITALNIAALTSKNRTVRRTFGTLETYSLHIECGKDIQGRVHTEVFNYIDALAEIIDIDKRSLFTSIYWCGIGFICNYEPLYAPMLDVPEVSAEIAIYSPVANEIIDKITLLKELRGVGLL